MSGGRFVMAEEGEDGRIESRPATSCVAKRKATERLRVLGRDGGLKEETKEHVALRIRNATAIQGSDINFLELLQQKISRTDGELVSVHGSKMLLIFIVEDGDEWNSKIGLRSFVSVIIIVVVLTISMIIVQ